MVFHTLRLPQTNSEYSDGKKEDGLVGLVGEIGPWQLLIFGSVSLVKLSSGWVQMAILFLTPSVKFWCAEFDSNSSRVVENSTCYEDCFRYEYDASPFENTVVTEWNLVCERAWLTSLAQVILQLGILIGSILFGFLSDRYGRKNTFLFSVIMLIVLGFGIAFSPNYIIFLSLRFFLGVATAGTMVVSFVIIMEAVGPKYRELLGCLYHIPFIIGHMTLPVFAYYYRSWNTYLLALAIPPLIYLSYFMLVNESPRWLLSVGRLKEASIILRKAAQMNSLPTANVDEALTKMSRELGARREHPRPNYWSLAGPALRRATACSCFMWLVCGFTFFGFNQYIGQTSPDPFVSVAAAGAIQIPANLTSIWLIRSCGRRFTTATFFFLCGLCIVAVGCAPPIFWLTITLGSLGVSCGAIVASSIYIYSLELFPTVVRNMGMGVSSTSMRLGSVVAPFVANLNAPASWLPIAVFGLASILAGLVTLLLPETKDRVLPDSIDHAKVTPCDPVKRNQY